MWRSEVNLQVLVFSSHQVVPFEPRSSALAAGTFILWSTLSAPIFDYFLVQNYLLFQGKVLRQFVSMRQEGSLVSLMRNFN